MTEADRGDTLVKKGTLVREISNFALGTLYRIRIHGWGEDGLIPETRTENFYVMGEVGNLVSSEGLVPVEKVDEDGRRERSFYRLPDLGMDIQRSVNPGKDFYAYHLDDLSWANWVEKAPVEEPTPEKP